MKDMNGVTLSLNARVKTKTGREAYVVSMQESSGQVRVRFRNGLIRKIPGKELERF